MSLVPLPPSLPASSLVFLGFLLYLFKKCLFIFICEREREGGREGDRELQAGFMLSAPEPDVGLEPTNHEIVT